PDPYGIDTWDTENDGSVFVHIINSEQYQELTNLEPPPTPITAQLYTQYGLPWFALYDEAQGDLPASDRLSKVKTIQTQDIEQEIAVGQDDESVNVAESQIEKLHHPSDQPGL
ncbi:MAG: hypothetical protein AB1589_00195, partial [Cyanobacteriota bacterium]